MGFLAASRVEHNRNYWLWGKILCCCLKNFSFLLVHQYLVMLMVFLLRSSSPGALLWGSRANTFTELKSFMDMYAVLLRLL